MFSDLDRTLEVLLNKELPKGIIDLTGQNQIRISFATPDERFPPNSLELPAIDLFLYDIRESRELRSNEWIIEKGEDGKATKKRAPVRIECSYLVTAWPSESSESFPTSALQEHYLLGEVAKVLLRYPTIPAELLQGSLQGQEPPLPTISLHQGHIEMMGQFWQALGGKLKVALSYTVTIGMDVYKPVEIHYPAGKKIRFHQK